MPHPDTIRALRVPALLAVVAVTAFGLHLASGAGPSQANGAAQTQTATLALPAATN